MPETTQQPQRVGRSYARPFGGGLMCLTCENVFPSALDTCPHCGSPVYRFSFAALQRTHEELTAAGHAPEVPHG